MHLRLCWHSTSGSAVQPLLKQGNEGFVPTNSQDISSLSLLLLKTQVVRDGPSLFLRAVIGIEMFLNWQVLKFIPLCLLLLEVQDALSHVLDISFVVQKLVFT